jgi:GNAT superfamily N-acetyltransferase
MTAPASDGTVRIRRITRATDADIEGLAQVLIDCVVGGASVSFMNPLSVERACTFWRRVAERVARGDSALLVSEDAHGIVGTVQLILDLAENQPHRADVVKMLVHRRGRRQGIGGALLREVEKLACELGKTLLVLDTASVEAERLYAQLGWVRAGVIPGFALLPDGGLCDTTFFYRRLDPNP